MHRVLAIWCALTLLSASAQQPVESTTCETNIVSATVVATYCSHRSGSDDVVDLMILWRGRAGWFERGAGGRYGTGGSHTLGGGTAGHVSESRDYGDIQIRYDADFDARTVTLAPGSGSITLDNVNALLVDGVDGDGRQVKTLRVTPRVTLGGDHNLKVIRSSPALAGFLRCDIPMPPARSPLPQPPVVTVCEKLAMGR
jgi:hypothetical protein